MPGPVQVVGANSADHDPTLELEAVPEPAKDAPPGSVLAQLRSRANVQRQERHLELPVGGAFEDKLVIRYGVLPQHEWDQYAVLLTPSAPGEPNLAPMGVLNVRMMAAACETVLWVEDGERHDLEVRLDGRLAEMLGHPLPAGTTYDDLTAAEVVAGLFASPMAVTSHAGELVRWMQDPSEPGGAEGEG